VLGLPLFELLPGFGEVGIRATKEGSLRWLIDALATALLVFEVSDALLQGLEALDWISGMGRPRNSSTPIATSSGGVADWLLASSGSVMHNRNIRRLIASLQALFYSVRNPFLCRWLVSGFVAIARYFRLGISVFR